MVQEKRGNIFTSGADIICHQCNCQGVMGAGIAKQIRDRYPEVYEEYQTFCSKMWPTRLLGKAQLVRTDEGKYIANLFGQLSYGTHKRQTDYIALKSALASVAMVARANKLTVAIPYGIGCGLAGGDWAEVRGIIETVFRDEVNVTIWKL